MLTVCSACRRHVRSADACPFCARRKRMRQAGLAFVAAATLAACQSQTPEPTVTPDQPAAPVDVAAPAEGTPAETTAEQPASPAPAEPVAEAPAQPETPAPNTTNPSQPGGGAANNPITASSYKRPMAMRYGLAPRPRPKPKQPVKK